MPVPMTSRVSQSVLLHSCPERASSWLPEETCGPEPPPLPRWAEHSEPGLEKLALGHLAKAGASINGGFCEPLKFGTFCSSAIADKYTLLRKAGNVPKGLS